MSEENDDEDYVGIDIGIAYPEDKSKDAYVAIKVSRGEIFLSVHDARDVAMSLAACANKVEQVNEKEKDNGSIQ